MLMKKGVHLGKRIFCGLGMISENVPLLLRIDAHPIKAVIGLRVDLDSEIIGPIVDGRMTKTEFCGRPSIFGAGQDQ